MISARTPGELIALFSLFPELRERYAKTLECTVSSFDEKLNEGLAPKEMRAILAGIRLLIGEADKATKSMEKVLS
jgi:hypothetical protein